MPPDKQSSVIALILMKSIHYAPPHNLKKASNYPHLHYLRKVSNYSRLHHLKRSMPMR
ncbi:hypothetical protein XaFJ1_GM001454 [Xanthomonas albilineans]|nr:hypothetical protein XaFJ1_GM001454 [Xanthomonas albilineans]